MPPRLDLVEPEAIRDEWAALWSRVPDATPFQHPAWLVPWWRQIAEGTGQTLALRQDGELLALFPLYIYDAERKLFPLGIATTDYLDALVAPGHAEAAMAALLRHLHAHRAGFARAEWPQLRPASPLLLGTAPHGWRDGIEESDPCPVLALPTRFDDLRDQVSAKTLRDHRTARRRAEEAGATFDLATPDTLDGVRDALFRLHAARWGSQGEAGVLAAEAVQAMHREALPWLLEAGLLRLLALRLGGEIIGVLHALADPPGRAERTLYLYLQGFDPDHARLSPGLLLVGEIVSHAIGHGFRRVDFLRGQERYKAFWGARNAPTFRRVLIPPEATP